MRAAHDLDLGGGHFADFVTQYGEDLLLPPAGFVWTHPRPDGRGECAGAVLWRLSRSQTVSGHVPRRLLSLHPLSVAGVLVCRVCGCAGQLSGGALRIAVKGA